MYTHKRIMYIYTLPHTDIQHTYMHAHNTFTDIHTVTDKGTQTHTHTYENHKCSASWRVMLDSFDSTYQNRM